MHRLPDSLAIALWVVGSCGALAAAACASGEPRQLILPLVAIGLVTGLAEMGYEEKREIGPFNI
jgi:hypothetical protein